jgi:hypothetical protein
MSTARMETAPVYIPNVTIRQGKGGQSRPTTGWIGARSQEARPSSVPAKWQLTDRGIAAVIVIAVVLMTAALVVIGLTAVRVTSADYDVSIQRSEQVRH